MSEWITDRRPTKDVPYGKVWISRCGCVMLTNWQNVADGEPWQPLTKPEPYVKPKSYAIEWSKVYECWMLLHPTRMMSLTVLRALNQCTDEHRKAAERIADIYEEVMP